MLCFNSLRVAKVCLGLQILLSWLSGALQGLVLDMTEDSKDTYTLPDGVVLNDGDTFEYIVVGAGAAGCAVAARLALAGALVLLVEAGGDPSLLTKIPAAAMSLLGSDNDWQYETIPNNISCLASRGRQCRFSRGRCLGGSTSINYMMYTRGNRRDFDFNITDWSWTDLKPYFLRYEGLQDLDRFPPSSIPYHNTTGILKIEYFMNSENPWHSRIIRGYRALKFPYNADVNGVSQIGISQVVGYVHKGERMSTARAYLGKEDVKRTLKVAKNTLCTGVIIDGNNITRGITVLTKSAKEPLRLFAKKEVILSAGTIGTPQILMLSGIGRAKHLKKVGIPVRVNLPVGDNMSDHMLPIIIILVDRGESLVADVANLAANISQFSELVASRAGAPGSIGLTDATAFANTLCYNRKQRRLQNRSDNCELPNLQVIHSYVDRNTIPLAKTLFQQSTGLDDVAVDQLAAANVNNAFLVVSPIVLTPCSRGRIRLASSDPSDRPAIFPNYLSNIRDVDQMLRSIKILEDLVETPDFKSNNATILKVKFDGCPSYENHRKGYWRCYVRHMTYAVFHAVGTSSLGKVVDIRLRVKGVKGLRVADASIFPSIPRGSTEAATVAVGERLVDFIKEDLQECRYQ